MTVLTADELATSFGPGAGVWTVIDRTTLATDLKMRLASPGSIAPPGTSERRHDVAGVPVGESGNRRCALRLRAAIDTALRLKAADPAQRIAEWQRALSGAAPSMLAVVAGTRRIGPADLPARPRSRRRWLLRLAAAVLLLCPGGGSYVWAQQPQVRDCAQCPEMVRIPAGSFIMGSPPGETDREFSEGPQHRVTIGYAFSLGKYEVTRGEFAAFVQATGRETVTWCNVFRPDGMWGTTAGRSWRNPGFAQTDRDPVVCVNWDDATAYVAWLSETTGKKYRLPSEAEWEYAARAGTTSARYWGDRHQDACRYANIRDALHGCRDGYAQTAPVGKFEPNAFGLYDMLGNTWEWVEDCAKEGYVGAPSDGSSWQRDDCSPRAPRGRYDPRRVLRGGSWYSNPESARAASSHWHPLGSRGDFFGFRVARSD